MAEDIVDRLKSYKGYGPLNGQTPCCVDRMTTIACGRLQMLNPVLFLYNCVHNADFAFVQCCRSCFDHKSATSLRLDYDKISQVLLTNPQSAICYDRRGEAWCDQLVRRKSFWDSKRFKNLDCASMPFAFRVCRMSCGYCSTNAIKAGAVYDYTLASDIRTCNNPAFALAYEPMAKRIFQKFERRFTSSLQIPNNTTSNEEFLLITDERNLAASPKRNKTKIRNSHEATIKKKENKKNFRWHLPSIIPLS
uniref:Uncharacterized protein n=1 Tax=Acrobeloides nanus TaxID=290746 RepID=A0A914CQG7_9BILA